MKLLSRFGLVKRSVGALIWGKQLGKRESVKILFDTHDGVVAFSSERSPHGKHVDIQEAIDIVHNAHTNQLCLSDIVINSLPIHSDEPTEEETKAIAKLFGDEH